MPDAVSLQDAGNLVSYVAPGYFVQWTYRRRFPAKDRPGGELILISTVLSLPFVALAQGPLKLAGHAPTSVPYVLGLLGPALAVGFLAGMIRASEPFRASLEWLGFGEQPEASMWLRTLAYLRDGSQATFTFKDGTQLAGVPRAFPTRPDDGVNEVYVVYPRWGVGDDFDDEQPGGVIVRLDEIAAIALSEDPLEDPVT